MVEFENNTRSTLLSPLYGENLSRRMLMCLVCVHPVLEENVDFLRYKFRPLDEFTINFSIRKLNMASYDAFHR